MYVKLKKARKGYRVYLVAGNHAIQTFSEAYATKWNAKRAARRMFPDLQRLDENGKEF